LTKLNWFFRSMTIFLAVLAVAFSCVLLAKDVATEILPQLPVHVLSAVSLLLVGAASLIVLPIIRLRPIEFLKNLLLAATFILWGIVQLMPQNILSLRLDNLVVALFVLDLAWAALLSVKPSQESAEPHGCSANCDPARLRS
jgi:hypothetical protein